jgi:fatty acid desaturase
LETTETTEQPVNEAVINTQTESTETNTNDKKPIGAEDLISLGQYNRAVSKELPKEIFKREPARLLYAVLFFGCVAGIVFAIMNYELHFVVKLALSIIMGVLVAGGTFLGHEISHGALVKGKKLQDFLAFFAFAPFLISPTYWRFWHNNLHHGNTQLLYKDPDAFPTKMIWKRSKFMKWAFPKTPGSGTVASYFYFFYWFSFQAVLNQVYMRFGNKMWDKMDHKKVTMEFTLTLSLALIYMGFIGVENWIWLAVIPFMVQNYTVMSYISTNHNLSPYTKINDPLMNSLTVTNNPIMEFVNLNFGYHTEHHLFPAMPASKAKIVSKKLAEMYPERYKIMPKSKALRLLYSTPRIYKNRDVLVDPNTGKEFRTLGR